MYNVSYNSPGIDIKRKRNEQVTFLFFVLCSLIFFLLISSSTKIWLKLKNFGGKYWYLVTKASVWINFFSGNLVSRKASVSPRLLWVLLGWRGHQVQVLSKSFTWSDTEPPSVSPVFDSSAVFWGHHSCERYEPHRGTGLVERLVKPVSAVICHNCYDNVALTNTQGLQRRHTSIMSTGFNVCVSEYQIFTTIKRTVHGYSSHIQFLVLVAVVEAHLVSMIYHRS